MEINERKQLKVVFGRIDKNNYIQLQQLNNLCLPVRYQNGFYARIVAKLRFGLFGNTFLTISLFQ